MHLLINRFSNPSACRTPQFTNVSEYIIVGGSPDAAESLRAHPSMCGLSYNVQVGPEGNLDTGRDLTKT